MTPYLPRLKEEGGFELFENERLGIVAKMVGVKNNSIQMLV